jgi:hypothetical protein
MRRPVELVIEQTSGRPCIKIHGAIDRETGPTWMIDVETVDAASTITLLEAIEALYPLLALIHVFLEQCVPPSCQAVAGMVGAARLPDQAAAAFHSILLPTSQIRSSGCGQTSPTADGTELAPSSPTRPGFLREGVPRRSGHRQLSCHLAQEFSGHDMSRV